MNVVPLAMALPYQVGIQSPAEEHFLAAFLREEIVEKMQGNGLIEFGAHGRTRTGRCWVRTHGYKMVTKWLQTAVEHGRRVSRLNLQLAPLSGRSSNFSPRRTLCRLLTELGGSLLVRGGIPNAVRDLDLVWRHRR